MSTLPSTERARWASAAEGRSGAVSWTADGSLAVAVSIWGLNMTIMKLALASFEPMVFAALRYGMAALVFVAVAALFGSSGGLRMRRTDLPRVALAGVCGIAINQASFVYGLNATGPSAAAILMATMPLFVAAMAGLFGLERLSARGWVGMLIGLAGVVLVSADSAGAGMRSLWGPMLVLTAAASYAGYVVLLKPLTSRYSPITLSAYTIVIGWLPIAAAAGFQASSLATRPPALGAWFQLLYSAGPALLVTNLLYIHGLRRAGVSRTALYMYLQPVVAVVAAGLLLHDRLTVFEVVGAGIVLAGVWLAIRSGWTPAEAVAP